MAPLSPAATMKSPVRAALRRLRPRVRRPGPGSQELFSKERDRPADWAGSADQRGLRI